MINYEAKTGEEYLLLLEKELKIKQKIELETARKMFYLNNEMKLDKVSKGSLTELKRIVANSTCGNNIKKRFGKLPTDFVWRTLFVYYVENDTSFNHLHTTKYYLKEKEGINLTWEAIKGKSPFEKIYYEDIYSPFLLLKDLPFIDDLLNKYLFTNGWHPDLLNMIGDSLILKELRCIVQSVHKNQVKDDGKNIVQLKCKIIHDLTEISKKTNFEDFKKSIEDLFLSYNITKLKINSFLENIDFKKLEELNYE